MQDAFPIALEGGPGTGDPSPAGLAGAPGTIDVQTLELSNLARRLGAGPGIGDS